MAAPVAGPVLGGKIKLTVTNLFLVTNLKLRKAREELNLRNTERNLSEEIQTIRAENDFSCLQLEDLKQAIGKTQCQIAVIGVCEASEKSKIENHIENITRHKDGYEQLFSKEIQAKEFQKMEMKKKEAQEKELEQQKRKAIEEKSQLQLKEAIIVERECDVIEQACVVLKKKNKAIMLKLRRQLLHAEELRRKLSRSHEAPQTSECKNN